MLCTGLLSIEDVIYVQAPCRFFFFFFLALTFICLLPPCTIFLKRHFIWPICFLNSPFWDFAVGLFLCLLFAFCFWNSIPTLGPQSEEDRESDLNQKKKTKNSSLSPGCLSILRVISGEDGTVVCLCLYLQRRRGPKALSFFWHLLAGLTFASHIKHSGSLSPNRKCR